MKNSDGCATRLAKVERGPLPRSWPYSHFFSKLPTKTLISPRESRCRCDRMTPDLISLNLYET